MFKAHEPEDEGYDAAMINGRYAASPDRRDYYHIGVVASVNPLRIRHMTSPTVKLDTKLGRWAYHGRLKRVNYTDSPEATEGTSKGAAGTPERSETGTPAKKAAEVAAEGAAGSPEGSETGTPAKTAAEVAAEGAAGIGQGGETAQAEQETVTIAGGVLTSPIRLRQKASRRSRILTEMPQHSKARLLTWGETWCRVQYGRRKGYVMTTFVHRAEG